MPGQLWGDDIDVRMVPKKEHFREADFQIALQDDEAFLDFQKQSDGTVVMTCASFDGAGAMSTQVPMGADATAALEQLREKNSTESAQQLQSVLQKYFDAARDDIKPDWHEDFEGMGLMS